MMEVELRKAKEDACFQATPIKMKKDKEMPERVKSDKKTTKAVGINLVSQERS